MAGDGGVTGGEYLNPPHPTKPEHRPPQASFF
jgi:hypothetical protein